MSTANLAGLVHIKTTFEAWEKLFLGHVDNREQVEAGNFIYAKVNDKTAMVMLKNVDMAAMAARMQDPEFAKLTAVDVESHEMYILAPMGPPSA